MSEQFSATHGPAEDDHIKRQDRIELRDHGDEWPDPEDSDQWPFGGVWAPEGRFPRRPDGPDFLAIEMRSELARHLDRTTFPASREQLLRTLIAHQAEPPVQYLVLALPPRTNLHSVGQLIRAVGLPIEERA